LFETIFECLKKFDDEKSVRKGLTVQKDEARTIFERLSGKILMAKMEMLENARGTGSERTRKDALHSFLDTLDQILTSLDREDSIEESFSVLGTARFTQCRLPSWSLGTCFRKSFPPFTKQSSGLSSILRSRS
jgi:hypothetical protein